MGIAGAARYSPAMDDKSKTPVLDMTAEMGVIRMRSMVGNSPEEAYRPRMCLWVDQQSGMILSFELFEPAENYSPQILKSFSKLSHSIGGVPRQVQLRDPALATELRVTLDPMGIETVVRESLPELDEAARNVLDIGGTREHPESGLMDVPGMTLDHIEAFADAARAFYEAHPWRYLIDDDLIAIESPAGPDGTQFTQVLGAGGEAFGLGFVRSLKAHEEMRSGGGLPRGGVWSLLYNDIDRLSYDDGELWDSHHLAVAGPDAYPSFEHLSISKGRTPPTPEQLTWAEGLLRALAATTEDELDTGRWEKQVTSFNGPATYKLSLPLLLEQMEGKHRSDPAVFGHAMRMKMESMLRGMQQQMDTQGPMDEDRAQQFLKSIQDNPQSFTPTTDSERAQDLCYQAFEARGRRQVQLARQALAIDPDCCDALSLLADRATDPESAIPLYERAVEAGARRLGPERFKEDAGNFWGIIETRPYLRARQRLALALMAADRIDAAAGHFAQMLELNPGDNQGNRYHLAQCLLRLNRLEDLEELLNDPLYADDIGAEWNYNRALLEFRRTGDSPASRHQLQKARRESKFVIPYLIGKQEMPPFMPETFQFGHEDEAVICVGQIGDAWNQTPGAIDWLRKMEKKVVAKQSGRGGKKGKRRK